MCSHPLELRSTIKCGVALILLGPVSHGLVAGMYQCQNVHRFPLACQANHLAQIASPLGVSSKKKWRAAP